VISEISGLHSAEVGHGIYCFDKMKRDMFRGVFEITHTLHTEKLIWQVDNISIQAGSPIEAGFLSQGEGLGHLF